MSAFIDQREKEIGLNVISNLLIFGCYSWYVYQIYVSENPNCINDFTFWGKTFLMFILVSIVAQIIIRIVFAILNKIVTNEDMPTLKDERDKFIELKALRISHSAYVSGFVLAMGSQAIGMAPWILFLILIVSGFLSAIVSEVAKIYFYRRGF